MVLGTEQPRLVVITIMFTNAEVFGFGRPLSLFDK